MQPGETFKAIISAVAPALRREGFKRRGQTFVLREAGNWGLLHFQRRLGAAGTVLFTVNLGVFSERLRPHTLPRPPEVPNVWSCHWWERIGSLLPGHDDHWWTLDPNTPVAELAEEIGCGEMPCADDSNKPSPLTPARL